jgi:hypothetical protein
VAVDTPVWLYALPAAIELDSPELRFDTWYLNFRPRLDAVETSSVRWRSALELEVTAPPGGFLLSTFERFMAFGAAPPDRPEPEPRPVRVASEGPRANPQRLVVTFQDASVRDSALIVRFTRDGIRRIEPVASPVTGHHAPDLARGARAEPSADSTRAGAGA